jgi:hypothetical protein
LVNFFNKNKSREIYAIHCANGPDKQGQSRFAKPRATD